MNFFNKYRNRLRAKKASGDKSVPDLAALNRLRHQYVQFCASTLTSPEIAGREFNELCSLDSVARIAFATEIEDLTLIIQTKGVILRDHVTGKFHDIGEMMLVMRRKPQVTIHFFNRTRFVKGNNINFSGYHHPHVTDSGFICSSNRDLIQQELAAGKVLSATTFAIEAINQYGPNGPFCDISFWPEIKLLPEN